MDTKRDVIKEKGQSWSEMKAGVIEAFGSAKKLKTHEKMQKNYLQEVSIYSFVAVCSKIGRMLIFDNKFLTPELYRLSIEFDDLQQN